MKPLQRRRRIVLGFSGLGAGMLGISLSRKPGSKAFYGSTIALALTWTTGGLLSGPLPVAPSKDFLRQSVTVPAATGAGLFGLFYGSALIARRIPVLNRALSDVMRYADDGATPLVAAVTTATGVAEEIFFRGALYEALGGWHPVAASTAAYTMATVPTRNPALVLAAGFTGAVWGWQRRATGGVVAPAVTHVTWSWLMLRFMPPLFHNPRPQETLQ